MFKKIISIALCSTLFAGQMALARNPRVSQIAAQHAGMRRAKALAQQKALQDEEQARRDAQTLKDAQRKRETNKQQGCTATEQDAQAAQAQFNQAIEAFKRDLAAGKITTKEQFQERFSAICEQFQLNERQAAELIKKIIPQDEQAQKQAQKGPSLLARLKGLASLIVANPIRSVLFTVGTIATIRYLYKSGAWSALKDWGESSWKQLALLIKYDKSMAGTVITLKPAQVIKEAQIIKDAAPMGKALKNLVKDRWIKTGPYRVWKSITNFIKEAATIVRDRGTPQIVTPAVVAPAITMTLPLIDNKKAVAWEIFKKQGGKLIDILSPLENPVSRVFGGMGL